LALHWFFASAIAVNVSDTWQVAAPDFFVFATVGGAFFAITLVAHFCLGRIAAGRSAGAVPAVANSTGVLLIPVAIRFAGTFLVLGVLLAGRWISKNESVFDVLFWYVTLTSLDISGIVWASRNQNHDSFAFGNSDTPEQFTSATKGI